MAIELNLEDLEELEQSLPQEELMVPTNTEEALAQSFKLDPRVLAARDQRDRQVADAGMLHGLTQIGTALASGGRVKADQSVYDAIKNRAQQGATEATTDAQTRANKIAQYMKSKSASDLLAQKLEAQSTRDTEQSKFRGDQLAEAIRHNKAMEGRALKGNPAAVIEGGLTEAEKAIDKKYAEQYNDFSATGRVNAEQTIEELKSLKEELLNEGDGLLAAGGGRVASQLPDYARSDKAIRWKTQIPAKANLVLKKLFGGQLSDDERRSESATYYNDLLNPVQNAELLQKKIDHIEGQLASETEKAKHYESNRTLKGFKSAGGTKPPLRRKDPKSGKVALYDPETKAFLRWE